VSLTGSRTMIIACDALLRLEGGALKLPQPTILRFKRTILIVICKGISSYFTRGMNCVKIRIIFNPAQEMYWL
jgi:hypothetical protein